MSDKKVDKKCIVCHNPLSIGDAIYAVNIDLVDDVEDNWDGTPDNRFRIVFKNAKKPKGAMHRECWNVHFGQHSEDNKKQTPTMSTNRLDTID